MAPGSQQEKPHEPATHWVAGRRWKYVVIAAWLGVLVISVVLSGKLSGVEKNDARATLPDSAESTQVYDLETAVMSPDTIPAVVVYERPAGLTPADQAKIAADAAAFGRRTDLDGAVSGPIVSSDRTAAQIVVPLNLGPDSFSKVADVVAAIRQTADSGTNGLAVHIAGPAGVAADESKAVAGLDTSLLLASAAVVVVILLLTYRSPLLWLLPLVCAGVALTGAQALIYLFARYAGLLVSADSAAILTILVFGAGTDYALLLIARYREELRRHADRHEAMAVALRRSAPAIMASAATVTAGMLCLMFADSNATRGLGPVFAIGIVVGVTTMLTLFPALLVTVGRWVFWPATPRFGSPEPSAGGAWSRVGRRIAARPRLTWVVTSLVLAALALGSTQLDSTGLTVKDSFRGHHDSIVGEEVLATHFAAGEGSPIVVVSRAEAADAVRAALVSAQGIDAGTVSQPVVRGGHAYLEGTLTDPADSKAAFATVDRVRTLVHAVPGAQARVGGDTALSLDVQRTARRDRNLIIPIVFAVVFLILVLLLRALVAPLLLIATVVLSFGTTLGLSALAFRHLFGFTSQDSSFPLFVFVFLVALGVDYNIFLMTRVREESARHGTRPAAILGLAATGGVITSAGLVLAGTFAVLATLPLTQIAELGFAVSLGILLDTIVVRSVLVTALTLDVGRHLWWPSPLAGRS